MLNQHFGMALDPDDLLQPRVSRFLSRCPAGYLRHWTPTASLQDTGSTISCDKDKFQANLDVQQFKPNEISVKVTGDNQITIEGKHEEKEDEHGYIFRHFLRRYTVPKNCDISKIESKLSSDGVLSITAPRVAANDIEHKTIPIQQTGKPVKAVEEKKCEKNSDQKCTENQECCKKQ